MKHLLNSPRPGNFCRSCIGGNCINLQGPRITKDLNEIKLADPTKTKNKTHSQHARAALVQFLLRIEHAHLMLQ